MRIYVYFIKREVRLSIYIIVRYLVMKCLINVGVMLSIVVKKCVYLKKVN